MLGYLPLRWGTMSWRRPSEAEERIPGMGTLTGGWELL